MDSVVTTVFFDGRFWVAMIEKISSDGRIRVGRHVFGPEPSNNDLRHFYLYGYNDVRVYESPIQVRVNPRRSIGEESRSTLKSKAAFKELQRMDLAGKKADLRNEERENAQERFRLKAEKRKKKHRGH
jgi:hypothetical protein